MRIPETGETVMFRKTIIAIAATAAIGVAALTPTAAAAHWHGHGHYWHGGYRVGIYVPTTYVASPDCYTVKRTVLTSVGPRPRYFTVCD
jgi:hypothetical protein